jgi:hypothetical protein
MDYQLSSGKLPELAGLTALRVPTEAHGVWYGGEGAWVRHATEGDLNRVIGTKERHVPVYRRKCDELWLLIVFEMLAGGTYVAPPVAPASFAVCTSFDRVFCISAVGTACVEVQTLASAA